MLIKESEKVHPQRGDALIVADVQRDFLPGGALGVEHGDEIIEPLNQTMGLFESRGLPIFYSQDWHPPHHISFKERGGPWPPHCVAGTPGAETPPEVSIPISATSIHKATDSDHEAYSAFSGTRLNELLKKNEIQRVFVGGLTTEYCVLNTVKDAMELGYDVNVLENAIRPVDPEDGKKAIEEIKEYGARIINTEQLG